MKCDVVIPVHNGEQTLQQTLKALASQAVPAQWQVRAVIVDDGSQDRSREIATTFAWPSGWEDARVLSQQNKGPGAARNAGVAGSDAEVIYFLGADILLRPNALHEHLQFHERARGVDQVALGMVRWDPLLRPSPLMEWLVHGGPQNDFDSLLGAQYADPKHFLYAANLSIKTKALRQNPFSEQLGVYGWEDLELGRRLAQAGVQLRVLHDALAVHRHPQSVRGVAIRQRKVGAAARLYKERYPSELAWESTPVRAVKVLLYRWVFRHPLRAAMQALADRYAFPRLFFVFTAAEFWVGWYTHKT